MASGKYRKIDPRIWNDQKFRRISDDAKLVFLFILTHPHMTALGAMRATKVGLAEELGWTTQRFGKAFDEAFREGLLEAYPEAAYIGAPKFLKYNPPESPNVIRAWAKSWSLIPECPLQLQLYQRAKAFAEGLGEAFAEAFAEACRHPSPNPEPEQEQEQEPELTAYSRPKSADRIPYKAVLDAWNRTAQQLGLTEAIELSPPRKRQIKARWHQAKWSERYQEALSRIKDYPFLRGNNPRGWRANFDWFLRPNTVTAILEGKYDGVSEVDRSRAETEELLRRSRDREKGKRHDAGRV